MYRSNAPPPADPELEVLEARLKRAVVVRRLVIGFGALILGIALFVFAALTVVNSFGRSGRSPIRLIACFVVGGALLGKLGFVILRRGELTASGRVHQVDPIAWSTLGKVSAGVTIVIALIAAWPFGVYEWLGSLRSPCRSVITEADAKRLALGSFDLLRLHESPLGCTLTGAEHGTDKRIVVVTLAGDKGGSQFPNELAFLKGKRTAVPGLGDEGYIIEQVSEYVVITKRRHAAAIVHLASRTYDLDAANRIAELLKAKMPLVDVYADAWEKKYPNAH